MQLRPYQNDLIQRLRNSYKTGHTSPCIVAPCGAGKSVILAEIAKKTTHKQNNVLFLVHRQELCEQIENTFTQWGVDMDYCTIGMVQTITRRLPKTVPPSLIITDENHHCLANSYKRIYEHFPKAKRVGVTATPIRLNGGGLGDINDDLIVGPSVKWLIENGYLAEFDYYAPLAADMSGIKVRAGEYSAGDASRMLDNNAVYGDVVKYYNKLSENKQAICYCSSVEHSKNMVKRFCDAGIWAEHIDGGTPKPIRQYAIDRFRAGEVMILCNVDLISEGFDVPDCNTAILLRPTMSLTLYIQQSMRCMRPKEGKRAIIIDHVGNYARHGLPDTEHKWSLKPKKTNPRELGEDKKIRQCPECFFTHEHSAVCPKCGFVYPVNSRILEEKREAKLELIHGFTLDFDTPSACDTLEDLKEYAKKHGYKRGWVWHQAKAKGLIM